ncbi:MAG: hypothetical protein HYU76_04930 [Betaproteobacteria bacterium]|nr:hypothetical protein [Betaproteobacteria bacterium]
MARPRRALHGGILLSLVLLWCMSFGPLPARAAAEAATQPSPACACCNPASGMPECGSVCNAPQQAVMKDLALPLGASFILAAAHSEPFEWADVAAPLRAARTPLAGPPLYLRLHRLRN